MFDQEKNSTEKHNIVNEGYLQKKFKRVTTDICHLALKEDRRHV